MTLKYLTSTTAPHKEKTDCLLCFVSGSNSLPAITASLNQASDGFIKQQCKAGNLGDSHGNSLLLTTVPGIAAKRLLLVYIDSLTLTSREAIKLADTLVGHCQQARTKSVSLCLGDLMFEKHGPQWLRRKLTEAFQYHHYWFDGYKTEPAPAAPLKQVRYLAGDKTTLKHYQQGLRIGEAIAAGVRLTRDLGNTPPNICNPTYLAKQARAMAKGEAKLKVTIHSEAAMEKMGMHSLLSVGRGSAQPSQLIVMEYNGGKKNQRPYALVGKGITFDSGGISIKPSAAMDEMKYDMCGAGAVFGALQAVIKQRLPINLVCVVAAAENMPSANASRPGDIVTSMSGKTIEILNTDCEGRSILCDALTYVQKFKPQTIINLATLTCAMIITLGRHAAGLFSNDDDFAAELIEAGHTAGDRLWPFPLWEEYREQIKTPFADIANLGSLGASSITAACFLAEFTQDQTWAHLDICGVSWRQGENKGATGKPVGLLVEYLMAGKS